MTDGSRVFVALRVPVTAERAFAAFTEQISEWWQPNGLFQFTEGRTGTLAFEPGPNGRLDRDLPRRRVVRRRPASASGTHPGASCSPGVTPTSPPTRKPSCTYGSTTSTVSRARPGSPSNTTAGTPSQPSTPHATASRWRPFSSASPSGGEGSYKPSPKSPRLAPPARVKIPANRLAGPSRHAHEGARFRTVTLGGRCGLRSHRFWDTMCQQFWDTRAGWFLSPGLPGNSRSDPTGPAAEVPALSGCNRDAARRTPILSDALSPKFRLAPGACRHPSVSLRARASESLTPLHRDSTVPLRSIAGLLTR